jgi:hypothetical protein
MYIAVGLRLLNFAARELQQPLNNKQMIIAPTAPTRKDLRRLIVLPLDQFISL